MLKRTLKLDLPKGQSIFLWGARKTGKSTFLKEHFSDSLYIDFFNVQ
jgi:predicted kinase